MRSRLINLYSNTQPNLTLQFKRVTLATLKRQFGLRAAGARSQGCPARLSHATVGDGYNLGELVLCAILLLDHLHDRCDRSLRLVNFEIVTALLGNQVLTMG